MGQNQSQQSQPIPDDWMEITPDRNCKQIDIDLTDDAAAVPVSADVADDSDDVAADWTMIDVPTSVATVAAAVPASADVSASADDSAAVQTEEQMTDEQPGAGQSSSFVQWLTSVFEFYPNVVHRTLHISDGRIFFQIIESDGVITRVIGMVNEDPGLFHNITLPPTIISIKK